LFDKLTKGKLNEGQEQLIGMYLKRKSESKLKSNSTSIKQLKQ